MMQWEKYYHLTIEGRKFGRLQAITDRVVLDGKGQVQCRCKCGIVGWFDVSKLMSGHTKSCGCLQRERAREANLTHGHHGTSTWRCWSAMRSRCFNPKASHFERYGGRGVTVCEGWNSFENFLIDMGERPSLAHSIDRIDPNGNYEPGNCRWAEKKEQARNSTAVPLYEFKGRTQSLPAWAEEVGVKANTLRYRIKHAGWSVAKALSTPV